MKYESCKRAEHLAEELRAGAAKEELLDHIRHCRACARVLRVHRLMTRMVTAEDCTEHPGPPPFERIWQQAALRNRVMPDRVARAMLPLRIAGALFWLVFLAVGLFLLAAPGSGIGPAWKSQFARTFHTGMIEPVNRLMHVSPFITVPMVLILLSFLACFISLLIRPGHREPLQSH